MIVKKVNQSRHNRFIKKLLNDGNVYITIIPLEMLWTYRSISYEDTIRGNVFMEFCIAPKSEKLYEILSTNVNNYEIYEKLPSWDISTWSADKSIYDVSGKLENRRKLTDCQCKFLDYSLMHTDITIISPSELTNLKNENVGNLFFITTDKKLFSTVKLYI